MNLNFSRNLRRSFAVAMSGWLLAACSGVDQLPTGPHAAPASAVSGSQTANALTLDELAAATSNFFSQVQTLGRFFPLQSEITVSAQIGKEGGKLSIPQAGLILEVPRGAVSSTTTFSVTALPGNVIAYEFGPHGMTFKKPLVLRQQLGFTTWIFGGQLKGGYFKSRNDVDTKTGKATIHEELPAKVKDGEVFIEIWHFSGYLVSMA